MRHHQTVRHLVGAGPAGESFTLTMLLVVLLHSLTCVFFCDRYVYQKGYVEVFVSPEAFQGLLPKLQVGLVY